MSIRRGPVVLASFVDNDDVVHKTATETITGSKTFNNDVYIQSAGANALFDDSNSSVYLRYLDKSGHITGWVENLVNHDGTAVSPGTSTMRLWARTYANNGFETGINTCIDVIAKADGTRYCRLPDDTYSTNFHGTATTALYADLAERYQTDQNYSVGTLIKFGGEKDITIADNKVNGVISDKPGFILDAELEGSLPIALVGKTLVRITGKINKFDNIALSEIPGVGRLAKEGETVIAKALEASEIEDEKLVLCVTKFNLD